MSVYTVIVPDAAVLQRVCGTNDSNVKLIESFLGVPVFARGNEISVEADSPGKEQEFRFIMDRLLDEITEGGAEISDADLLRSVLHTDAQGSSKQYHITVPGGIRKIYPRTEGQCALVQGMRNADLVFAEGPAGSGKTFLMVAEALRLVLSHEKSGIVLTRPVVEAGESLGYLPGDLQEKINPYIRPLYDSMNAVLPRETVKKMTESGIIETAPLAYMRGRTLNDSVIILDEAQNTTVEQMKMFLTRMGEGSKVFVTGDLTQVDLPHHAVSGLAHALGLLKTISGISIIRLSAEDVVRSGLVKRIIQAYENEKREN